MMTMLACGNGADHKAKIQQAVRDELQRYPQARLIDLYKFFFQGAFGPGHLVRDANAAGRFLEIELRQARQFSVQDWQPVGHDETFFRLNLRLVRDGVIPFDVYKNAFVQSAAHFQEPDAKAWQKEWRTIVTVISEMGRSIDHFQADSLWLEQQIKAGRFVVHHSEVFKELYHPHYRVVDRALFEELYQHFLQ